MDVKESGGGGGGGTGDLIGFFSTFSIEGSGGGDEKDCFVTSGDVIDCLVSAGVETSISSSTSGTANIFFYVSRVFFI